MKGYRHVTTLSNGKKVANFSSPHPFTFTDGSILPAMDLEISKELSLKEIETPINDKGDIEISFEITGMIEAEMHSWEQGYKRLHVDVVICPLPMIMALKKSGYNLLDSPFRTVRMSERGSNLVLIDKQCL
tara:strand:- start:48 stop:440 length:393 start_codon:yes stop_codon:yes gene_type:complete